MNSLIIPLPIFFLDTQLDYISYPLTLRCGHVTEFRPIECE